MLIERGYFNHRSLVPSAAYQNLRVEIDLNLPLGQSAITHSAGSNPNRNTLYPFTSNSRFQQRQRQYWYLHGLTVAVNVVEVSQAPRCCLVCDDSPRALSDSNFLRVFGSLFVVVPRYFLHLCTAAAPSFFL